MSIGIVSLFHGHTDFLYDLTYTTWIRGWDELVIIDNASPLSDTRAFSEAAEQIRYRQEGLGCKPLIRIYRHSVNDCLPAINAGMNSLSTDIVISLSNDVVMTDELWLQWLTSGITDGIMQGPRMMRAYGIDYIDGSTFALTKNDWLKLGGFDTMFRHPGYWADPDLSHRASQLGIELRQIKSGINHRGKSTIDNRDIKQQEIDNEYNRKLFRQRLGLS